MYSCSTRSHLQFARPAGVYACDALIVFCWVYFFYHQRGRHRLSVTTKTGKGEIFGCKILEAKDPGTVLSD